MQILIALILSVGSVAAGVSRRFHSPKFYLGKQPRDLDDVQQQCIRDVVALIAKNPTLNQTLQNKNHDVNKADRACGTSPTCIIDEDEMDSALPFDFACVAAGGILYKANSNTSCSKDDGLTVKNYVRKNIRACFSAFCDPSIVADLMIGLQQPSEDSDCVLINVVTVTDASGDEIGVGNPSAPIPTTVTTPTPTAPIPTQTQSPSLTPTTVTTAGPIPAPTAPSPTPSQSPALTPTNVTTPSSTPGNAPQCDDATLALNVGDPTLNKTLAEYIEAFDSAINACVDNLTCFVDFDTFDAASSYEAACDVAGGIIYKANSSSNSPVDGATVAYTLKNTRLCVADSDSCNESSVTFLLTDFSVVKNDCVFVGEVTITDVSGNKVTTTGGASQTQTQSSTAVFQVDYFYYNMLSLLGIGTLGMLL